MKKIVKVFRIYFSHFQTKLLCAFLLCTMIPLCMIGGISYRVSYRLAEENILNTSAASDEQLNMQFNTRIRQAENTADSIQYDMYTLTQAATPMESLTALTDTRSNLSMFKNTFGFSNISVFLPENHLGANESLYFFPLSQLENFCIPADNLENPGTSSIWFYQPNLSVPFLISDSKEGYNSAACCRILKNPDTGIVQYAYILFLDTSEFSNILEEAFPDPAISSYLLTESGEMIAHNKGTSSKDSSVSADKLAFLSENVNSTVKHSRTAYRTEKLENGWYHVTEIPDSYINRNTRILISSILITLILSLPVTLLVVVMFSRNLTKRIKVLSQAMESLQLDTPDFSVQNLLPAQKPAESLDEIDRLGLTFQKMQLSLKENLQSILDLSLAEERLKYQLLQSQINPHFLYNILGSIQTCQSLGKLDIANQMLTNLTRFYRMTLRKSNDLIQIKDELEIARLYLEIEKLCRRDTLTWDIQAEDGIENFLICKFTLQPFLENSILHGISQRTPHLHIQIQVLYGDDTVMICIKDNGIGIEADQLKELQKTLETKSVSYEKHFGIGNVNKRISNPYFGRGSITIESRLYEGTEIRIEFDQMEEEHEESNDC